MKKISLLSLPLILLASNSNINDKIQKLEDEVKKLKQEMLYHQEDLDERMPIIEQIEKKSILDKVNFSPELLLRFDKLKYKTGQIEGENTLIYNNHDSSLDGQQRRDEFSKDFDIASSIRFRLNMNVDFNDVKFYGRMLYMNSSQSHQRLCILSRDIKTGTSGSAFDVDRAYFDYAPNYKSDYTFTFSFGILPTTGGTPMQYAQNKKRNSMFPALVFDMNTYGMIGTQKLGSNTYARFILAKPYTLRPNFYPYQCNRENIDNADIVGLYSDTKFNFLGKSLLSFGVNMMHDLQAHPYLGPDIDSSDSHTLGTMVTFGFGLDIEKVLQTETTLFVHTALSNPHANGEQDDYQIVAITGEQTLEDGLTANGDAGFTTSTYASGEMLSTNGYSVYLGTKYNVNEKWHIGVEYNYGSKYWFSATQGAEDMFNKLATRGPVYEVYGVWKYHKYFNTKLSYLNIHENYTGSGWHFGEPAKKDATQSILSLSLEARF
jgi:opacity protein-like surface antigen